MMVPSYLMMNLHNIFQVCFLPQDDGSFRKLVPQSEFDRVTEVLDSLDEKSMKALEFIALFGNSSTAGNLVWALRYCNEFYNKLTFC